MLISTIRETIERLAMIAPGDRVLVALSGGPDSVALLRALFELRGELECELCAAHLNHKLRGKAGDEDERWCSELAQSLELPFRSARVDVNAEVRRLGGNLEEVARELRYSFLEEAAERLGAARIAVAHTLDDQAETVLLRLLRGAGAGGLRGMRPIRGRIIRPLLDVQRSEVLDYLRERNQPYRVDASNTDERFSRAFLRRKAIPLLRQLNPSMARTFATTAAVLGSEDDFLRELAHGVLQRISVRATEGSGINAGEFASLHTALQRRVLRRLVARELGSLRGVSFRAIEAMRRCALGEGPGVDLGGGWTVRLDGELLTVLRKRPEERIIFRYRAAPGQRLDVKEVDKRFDLRIIEARNGIDIERLSGPGRAFLDADAVGDRLEVRGWQPGDRYRPLRAPGSRKLQDLFVNAKLQRFQRYRSPVFLARGRICWVSGLRVGDEFRVTPRTTRILSIEEVDDG